MVNEKNDEKMDKGFVVRDRRFSAKKEKEEDSQAEEAVKKGEPKKENVSNQEIPLPEVNFINFLFSLSTSALIQLGEIQDPATKQVVKNLPLAKHTIDLISMLKEKTKGNLTSEEEKYMDNILYDLRMRYVRAVS